jgi:2-C-methyl-D-erythritol 4-phosphate cytidylyltransferase
MIYGIIVAAGKSERMGPSVDKAFLSLGTQPVLAYSLQAFEKCPEIDGVILVVRKDRLEGARGMVQLFGCSKVTRVVAGGAQRQTSVQNGLALLPDDVRVVAVHDGGRPCVTPELISATIKSAKKYGSGVAAVKITDTVKEVPRGLTVSKTIDRSKLWAVQTPQTFKRDLLIEGYAKVKKKGLVVTDEATAAALVQKDIKLVPSSWTNIKITTAEDLTIAAALLKG